MGLHTLANQELVYMVLVPFSATCIVDIVTPKLQTQLYIILCQNSTSTIITCGSLLTFPAK